MRDIVELQSVSAYNGYLKPKNVLINSSGQATPIDFLPMGTSDAFVAPEVPVSCSMLLRRKSASNAKMVGRVSGIEIVEKCLDSDPY
ncbi:hypothetical protein BS47DRAFT_1341383 [Hydnum rufescens UP504]|uniref:Uncharacterized protein n=1 Tax=Hydnum rufescens UP504 TaxID=1448309 RepID=A0A9P6DV53_9AGAM|nr:hypothetical protein BS47DRAFT_1341383 [Hydnum rufescens UP504]